MFARMYKCVFGEAKVFATEVNDEMRSYLEELKSQIHNIEDDSNMIKYIHDIENGLKTYKKDIGIEGVQDLHSELSGFLYHYQKAIPFEKTPYTQPLQPTSKYCFKKGLRIKSEDAFYKEIITKKWASEAVLFVEGNKTLLDKILAIYTELDCQYQHPDTFSIKKLNSWKFTMGSDGVISNSYKEKHTLTEMFSELVQFEEGIYNDTSRMRHWGLYNSTFYHIVMYNLLSKIVSELEAAIQ